MKSKTSAALLLVAIFCLGCVAGGFAHFLYRANLGTTAAARARVPNSHDIVEEMALQLKMDSRQKEQLRVIVQQSRDRYRVLSRQFQPQYEKIRGETNEAIRTILSPDQRRQYDATLERMDARHREHTHDSQPGPPPTGK